MSSQTGESDCGNYFVRGPITALSVSVSPWRSDGHTDGDDAEGLRQALRLRRELSVTYVQHFTQEYKSGFRDFHSSIQVLPPPPCKTDTCCCRQNIPQVEAGGFRLAQHGEYWWQRQTTMPRKAFHAALTLYDLLDKLREYPLLWHTDAIVFASGEGERLEGPTLGGIRQMRLMMRSVCHRAGGLSLMMFPQVLNA